MKIGVILWEGVTVVVIILGALTVFFLRRRLSGRSEGPPASLWIRFSLVLFAFCLLAVIEGAILPAYGLFWFFLALGATTGGVAIVVLKLKT